jgi:oligopeptide transport system permease protein
VKSPVLKRVQDFFLTLIAVHAATFFLLRAARGGPFDAEREFSPQVLAALREKYYLHESLIQQYGRSLWGFIRGDFGSSMRYRDVEVGHLIWEAMPVSLILGLGAFVLAFSTGVSAGLWAAHHQKKRRDSGLKMASTLALALPNFVIAGLAIALFSFGFGWLPPAGFGRASHYVLPILSLSLPFAAQIFRLTRHSAIEVLATPAILSARGKGLPTLALYRRHVLPLALVPVIAFLGPATAGLLTGSLVIEQVFALPGLGSHFVQSALNRDYTLALGITFFYTALLGTLTMTADLLLSRLDPRMKLWD